MRFLLPLNFSTSTAVSWDVSILPTQWFKAEKLMILPVSNKIPLNCRKWQIQNPVGALFWMFFKKEDIFFSSHRRTNDKGICFHIWYPLKLDDYGHIVQMNGKHLFSIHSGRHTVPLSLLSLLLPKVSSIELNLNEI